MAPLVFPDLVKVARHLVSSRQFVPNLWSSNSGNESDRRSRAGDYMANKVTRLL